MSRGKAYTPDNDMCYWRDVCGYNEEIEQLKKEDKKS